MTERFHAVLFLLILLAAGASAQSGTFIAGGGAVYQFPIGSLADRFHGAAGGMIYAGQQVDADWTWIGRLEYVELTELNTDKLTKRVTRQEIGGSIVYTFPMPKLSMSLKAAGLTAVGKYNVFRESFIESDVQIGFGFTNWTFQRGVYRDSLFVDSSGTKLRVLDLAVPANTQSDWSGTLIAGVNADLRIVEPVWLSVGVNYTLIIGELWQALALDMENISGMQFLSVRSGLHVYF
jgi:hypothetical protein